MSERIVRAHRFFQKPGTTYCVRILFLSPAHTFPLMVAHTFSLTCAYVFSHLRILFLSPAHTCSLTCAYFFSRLRILFLSCCAYFSSHAAHTFPLMLLQCICGRGDGGRGWGRMNIIAPLGPPDASRSSRLLTPVTLGDCPPPPGHPQSSSWCDDIKQNHQWDP